ncbi:MAG: hypothetical protein U0V03_09650 [Bacteroidia bacterium]
MKTILNILFLFVLTAQMKSQTLTPQETAFRKEMIERDKKNLLKTKEYVSHIFEGEIIQSDEFYNDSLGVYVQNKVKVKSQLKGKLKDSIIIVITEPYVNETFFPDALPALQKNIANKYTAIFYTNKNKIGLGIDKDQSKEYYRVYRQVSIMLQKQRRSEYPFAVFGHATFMDKKELYDAIGVTTFRWTQKLRLSALTLEDEKSKQPLQLGI